MIYNESTFPLGEDVRSLVIKKGDKEAQFGMITNHYQTKTGEKVHNINVHLNGGKAEKDKLIRNDQLEHLRKFINECKFEESSHIVLSGDFNTDIDEIKEFVNTNLGLTYTF